MSKDEQKNKKGGRIAQMRLRCICTSSSGSDTPEGMTVDKGAEPSDAAF